MEKLVLEFLNVARLVAIKSVGVEKLISES